MCTLIAGCLWALLGCDPDLVRPVPEPAFVQAGQQSDTDLVPDADTHVSRSHPAANFGADTVLGLDPDHRPLLRWDSASIAEAVGGDLLVAARLELDVLSNDHHWGTEGRWISVHGMSEPWTEMEAAWSCVPPPHGHCMPWEMDSPMLIESTETGETFYAPWNPEPTDSVRVADQTDGVVTFDVTDDVLGILTGGVYRFGWLVKKVDESASGSATFGSREGGSPPRLVLTLASGDTVPAVPAEAPDTVPEGFYDEENIRMGSVCQSGPMLKGIVAVWFEEEATQAEKQEAIDLIQGEVIGGVPIPGMEGFYYVRVEDDEDGQILCDAILTLEGLPQVGLAGPASFSDPDHRRPNDAEGEWSNSAWGVDPESVMDSERWGLEMIAGPLAWGCETGNEQTPIAVVDMGFQAVADLMENVPEPWRGDVGLNETTDHGTKVASVLAARGDNGAGITGVMWQADLRPYDVMVVDGAIATGGSSDERIVSTIVRAVTDGARVINLSLGLPWLAGPDVFSEDDHARVSRKRDRLVRAFELLGEDRPLLVLSAGNDTLDAYWNGWTAAKPMFPEHILVVDASTVGNNLWAGSNHGELVDIVAPGASVATLDSGGNVDRSSGTSYAAPHAAGVAGLLMSFDPQLAPSEVKQLIVESAVEGGRFIPSPSLPGQIPLLNAYQALKAAAEREGAPLCGNRTWSAGGQAVVQRNRDADTREVLYNPGGELGNVHVFHGGRRIDLRDLSSSENLALAYSQPTRTWQVVSDPPTTPPGGTFRSQFGESHDGDRYLDVAVQSGSFSDTYSVRVSGPDGLSEPVTISVPIANTMTLICVYFNEDQCLQTGSTGSRESTSAGSAFSPVGDRALLAVNVSLTTTLSMGPWGPCIFAPEDEDRICREIRYDTRDTGSRVFSIDLLNRTFSQIGTVDDQFLFYVGISEAGEEFVSGELNRRRTSTFRASANGAWSTFSDPPQWANCQIAYRSSASAAPTGPLVPTTDECGAPLTGTIAPQHAVPDVQLTPP